MTTKRKESPYKEMSRDKDQKSAYISNEMQLQNHFLTFIQKKYHFFQLPALYLAHPWLTTLLLPWTS